MQALCGASSPCVSPVLLYHSPSFSASLSPLVLSVLTLQKCHSLLSPLWQTQPKWQQALQPPSLSLPCPVIHPSFTHSSAASLHSVGAVAPIVHSSGDGHYDSRYSISCQVEVLSPGVFALKHLYQHDVELYPFQEHPGERCQEEEMEQGRKDCADNLVRQIKDWEGLKIQ